MPRDYFGFLDLNDYIDKKDNLKKLIHFKMGSSYYYYRECGISEFYNELIISRVAKVFGIKCPKYDLGEVSSGVGVYSRDLNDEGAFLSIDELIKDIYGIDDYNERRKYNNIESIRELFKNKFKDDFVVDSLIHQLDDLFVFDILVGNSDRNITNYGVLITDDNISIAVIDNSNSLDEDVLYSGDNQIKVSNNESDLGALLRKRPEEYQDYILEKIDQIDLPVIFESIEEEISASINPSIKEKTAKFLKSSTTHIKRVISKTKAKKL